MSVLVSKRQTSKFEVITFSVEIHHMLTEFAMRDFGIKDIDHLVRMRYAQGKDSTENFPRYRMLLHDYRKHIEEHATLLTNHVRAANTIYPTSEAEYNERRKYQDYALVECELLIKDLQQIVDIFDVDLNTYDRYIKAIDREIGLIKKWRQRDNRFKSQ